MNKNNWQNVIFDDVVRLKRGYDLPNQYIVEGDYPVVTSSDIKAKHNAYKVEPPGVITGRSGTLGIVRYINEKFWPLNTALYAKDFKGNDPKFVYYFLTLMKLENFNAGAGVPTLNQNHLHKIPACLPPLDEQRKIAYILSAYDDSLENNIRRIALLEKMAYEIYREWFVRFRFPGNKNIEFEKGIPKEWGIVELNEIAKENSKSTKPGNHLENRYYMPLDLMGSKQFLPLDHYSHIEAQSSLITFEKNEFIFGAMRPYQHKIVIAPFDGITRTTCFVIKPKEEYLYSYLYLTLFKESTIDYAMLISHGADRPYTVWNRGFERMKVLRPDKKTLEKFEESVRPILDSILEYYFIQRNLQETRDLLLPRLISGKLSVEDLDIRFPPSMLEDEEVAQMYKYNYTNS